MRELYNGNFTFTRDLELRMEIFWFRRRSVLQVIINVYFVTLPQCYLQREDGSDIVCSSELW